MINFLFAITRGSWTHDSYQKSIAMKYLLKYLWFHMPTCFIRILNLVLTQNWWWTGHLIRIQNMAKKCKLSFFVLFFLQSNLKRSRMKSRKSCFELVTFSKKRPKRKLIGRGKDHDNMASCSAYVFNLSYLLGQLRNM